MNDPTSHADVLCTRIGRAGVITLNRPQALNALTRAMCLTMSATLADWARDPSVALVIVRGTGDRAFCAGGDIRALYESGRSGTSYRRDFYADEYRLNTQIKEYPKPYVALMDGITMGGGVGVAIHGSHRIVSERTVFAMPETGIGLCPDVGATYFLPRLPGVLGRYLGLTGARLDGADMMVVGLGDHYVPSHAMDRLFDELTGQPDVAVDDLCTALQTDPPPSDLPARMSEIGDVFSAPSLEAVVARVGADADSWQGAARKAILGASPTALKIAWRQIAIGGSLDFRDCMRLEYRLVQRIMDGHDFYEGVRAAVIDKDRSPAWRPPRLEDVTEAEIDRYFATAGADELTFPT